MLSDCLLAGFFVECLRLQPGGQEGLPHPSVHCPEGGQATAQEDRGHQGVAGKGQGARAGQETEQGLGQGNERGHNLFTCRWQCPPCWWDGGRTAWPPPGTSGAEGSRRT